MIRVTASKERFLAERDLVGKDFGEDLDIFKAAQEMVEWCVDNCSGYWEWQGLFLFYFEDESDAAYFSMVWG